MRELAVAMALLQGDPARLPALLAGVGGADAAASGSLGAALEDRRDLEAGLPLRGVDCSPLLMDGTAPLQVADGASLTADLWAAGHLRGAHLESCIFDTVRIAAPFVRKGREDVLRWVRSGRRGVPWLASPTELLVVTMDLARAAEVLGDRDLAASYRARADRFYRALLRRDIAVPLAALDWIRAGL